MLCFANPAISQLAKVLTKIALEGARVVLFTPKKDSPETHAYCMHLLHHTTVRRTEFPNGPIYVPEDSQDTMSAPGWGCLLSIVDCSLTHVPVVTLTR